MRCLARSISITMLVVAAAYASNTRFMTSDGRLSLEIPSEMETISVENPQVEIAARAKGGGFPTFNLIAMGGRYDIDRPTDAILEEVSRGYRGIGLTDAHVTAGGVESVDGVRVFHAELAYIGPGDAPFVASVWIVPSGDRHFIATFMDTTSSYTATASIEARIVDSMSIEKSRGDDSKERSGEDPIGWPLAAGAALAFATLFLALRQRRKI